jgi:hypothetical protein
MSRDIYQSAWGYNYLCSFYKRQDNNSKQSEMTYNDTVDGAFNARILQPETREKQMIDDIFQFDSSNITIKTRDDVISLSPGDLVVAGGKKYILVNKQSKPRQVNSEFDNAPSSETFLSLRGK